MSSVENDVNTSNVSEDQGITMVDVLNEEEELAKDADAVLGAGDDSVCTYGENPIKRQALYSCMTCIEENSDPAGVCLGCSYHCHDGHNLIELYTKRNFKCDCGNSKFTNACKLMKDKTPINEGNSYNQNFVGKYCTCERPYPDPEDKIEDSMLQCIICEDWYHGRHLKATAIPKDDSFEEMICYLCVEKNVFLMKYQGLTANTVINDETNEDLDISQSEKSDVENKDIHKQSNEGDCKLMTSVPQKNAETLFFKEKWRSHLCACADCKKMYEDKKLEYLVQEDDTVGYYEAKGKENRKKRTLDNELDALSSLDRVTRTEMVCEYNDLSSALRDYLRTFAETGKVVTDENIRDFFSDLKARKRQKTNNMSYYCK